VILIEVNLFEMPKIGTVLRNKENVLKYLGFIKLNSGD
jgi:hypothetical protein